MASVIIVAVVGERASDRQRGAQRVGRRRLEVVQLEVQVRVALEAAARQALAVGRPCHCTSHIRSVGGEGMRCGERWAGGGRRTMLHVREARHERHRRREAVGIREREVAREQRAGGGIDQ